MNWPEGTHLAIIRDGCCVVGGSMKGLCPHHIEHEGAGGTDDMFNIATLCQEHHNQAHAGYLVVDACVDVLTARRKGLEILWHREEIDEFLRRKIMTRESYGY